jgi:hypothetical protein
VAFDERWLAGFFDGEGSIGVYSIGKDRTKRISYYVLRVSLAQSGEVGKLLCGRLQTLFGGTTYKNKSSNTKEQWKWNVSSKKALDFLKVVEPHLLIKKRESELAQKFQALDSKRTDYPPAKAIAEQMVQIKVNY